MLKFDMHLEAKQLIRFHRARSFIARKAFYWLFFILVAPHLSDEFDAAEDAEVDNDPGDAGAESQLPDDGALIIHRVGDLQHVVAETAPTD